METLTFGSVVYVNGDTEREGIVLTCTPSNVTVAFGIASDDPDRFTYTSQTYDRAQVQIA